MTKNTRRFEFSLGRTGLFSFVLGMAVLVFIFFLLGVKVGAYLDTYPEKLASLPSSFVRYLGLSPEDKMAHRQKLASLRQEKESIEEKITPAVEETNRQTEDITGKQAGAEEVPPEGKDAPAPPDQAKTPIPKPMIPPTVNQKETRTAPPATNQMPGEKSVTENTGKYFIQVASFREREKAEQFCAQVALLGFKPEVESREQKESDPWFRVVIRSIQTEEEARRMIALLHKKYKGLKCVLRKSGTGNNQP